MPSGASADIWSFWIATNSSTTLASSVATVGSELKVYRYADVSITIDLSTNNGETGSDPSHYNALPSAKATVTGQALQSYVSSQETANPDTDNYITVRREDQSRGTLIPFTFSGGTDIDPSGATGRTKVQVNDRWAGSVSGTEGHAQVFDYTNNDPSLNGGTQFAIVALNAKEVGSAGELYGYIYLKRLGTSSFTTTIDIDDIFNVPDTR